MEEWRTVEGWPYEVSSHGRVRRTTPSRIGHTWRGRVLSTRGVTTQGYQIVTLCRNGERWSVMVHQLVAAAFIGPCPDGLQVNHRNGTKLDNRPENLEYVTPAENIRHALDTGIGTVGERNGNTSLSAADARAIVIEVKHRGEKHGVVAKRYGIKPVTVSAIVNGRNWAHATEGLR